ASCRFAVKIVSASPSFACAGSITLLPEPKIFILLRTRNHITAAANNESISNHMICLNTGERRMTKTVFPKFAQKELLSFFLFSVCLSLFAYQKALSRFRFCAMESGTNLFFIADESYN